MYSFDRRLFVTPGGRPMVFYLHVPYGIQHSLLIKYIKAGGGIVDNSPYGPHTIIVCNECRDTDYGVRDVFVSDFIVRCCTSNKILPLKKFRVRKSFIDDNFDPSTILLQSTTWETAKEEFLMPNISPPSILTSEPCHRTSMDGKLVIMNGQIPKVILERVTLSNVKKESPDPNGTDLREKDGKTSDSSDSSSVPPSAKALMKRQRKRRCIYSSESSVASSASGKSQDSSASSSFSISEPESTATRVRFAPRTSRLDYTHDEDKMIVDFIVKSRGFSKLTSVTLWKQMEVKFPNRSWHSLKNRFLRTLSGRLDTYDLHPEVVAKLKNCFEKSQPNRCFKPYRPSEDKAIMNYVEKHRHTDSLHGNRFWKTLESKGIIEGRSWHSLRERYMKHLEHSRGLSEGAAKSSSRSFSEVRPQFPKKNRLLNRNRSPPGDVRSPNPGDQQRDQRGPSSVISLKSPVKNQPLHPERSPPTSDKKSSSAENHQIDLNTACTAVPNELPIKKKKRRKLFTQTEDPNSPRPSDFFPTPVSVRKIGPSVVEKAIKDCTTEAASRKRRMALRPRKVPLAVPSSSNLIPACHSKNNAESDPSSSSDSMECPNTKTSNSIPSRVPTPLENTEESTLSLIIKDNEDVEKLHQSSQDLFSSETSHDVMVEASETTTEPRLVPWEGFTPENINFLVVEKSADHESHSSAGHSRHRDETIAPEDNQSQSGSLNRTMASLIPLLNDSASRHVTQQVKIKEGMTPPSRTELDSSDSYDGLSEDGLYWRGPVYRRRKKTKSSSSSTSRKLIINLTQSESSKEPRSEVSGSACSVGTETQEPIAAKCRPEISSSGEYFTPQVSQCSASSEKRRVRKGNFTSTSVTTEIIEGDYTITDPQCSMGILSPTDARVAFQPQSILPIPGKEALEEDFTTNLSHSKVGVLSPPDASAVPRSENGHNNNLLNGVDTDSETDLDLSYYYAHEDHEFPGPKVVSVMIQTDSVKFDDTERKDACTSPICFSVMRNL